MLEIFSEAVSLYTFPFTLLLGVCVLYWLMVGVGLLDMDGHAIDVGHDVQVGSDVHVGADVGVHDFDAGHGLHAGDAHAGDVHAHAGAEHDAAHMHHGPDAAHGAIKSMLQFLNFGDVPAMIVVSIMSLSAWTCSMVANHYFNEGSILRAVVLLAPNVALTIVLTKLISTPLKKLFNTLNREYEEHKPIIGRACTVITSEVTENFGQAQIETSGAPLIINVRTYGGNVLVKGESALVIREEKETQLFTVAKLSNTKQQGLIC